MAQGLLMQGEERLELTPALKSKGHGTTNGFLGAKCRSWDIFDRGEDFKRPFDTDEFILALPAPSWVRMAKLECHGYLVYVWGLLSTLLRELEPAL
jgi:hypothetical protein